MYPILVGSMYSIFTYIYYKNQPNEGKYTSLMDPMGTKINCFFWICWIQVSQILRRTPLIITSGYQLIP